MQKLLVALFSILLFATAARADILTVQEGKIYRPDGSRWIARGLDWESQLAYWEEKYGFAVWAIDNKLTTTSITIYGGDDTSINILTADDVTLGEWRFYIELLNDEGITPILYASEWEHNRRKDGTVVRVRRQTIPEEVRLDIVDKLGDLLDKGLNYGVSTGHLQAIICGGEEYDAGLDTARAVSNRIRQRIPGRLIAYHNPHSGISRSNWEQTMAQLAREGLVDILLLQETPDGVAGLIKDFSDFQDVACIAHERLHGASPSNITEGLAWSTVAPGGFVVYTGYCNECKCDDLYCPDPSDWTPWFREVLDPTRPILKSSAGVGGDYNTDWLVDCSDIIRRNLLLGE